MPKERCGTTKKKKKMDKITTFRKKPSSPEASKRLYSRTVFPRRLLCRLASGVLHGVAAAQFDHLQVQVDVGQSYYTHLYEG